MLVEDFNCLKAIYENFNSSIPSIHTTLPLTYLFYRHEYIVGAAYIEKQAAIETPALIAIIVICIVLALVIGLLLMFCRCKRNQNQKSAAAKDYEMDSVRPSIVPQQNQAPPPYYPATSGLENKALEHSMDLALALEDQKNAVYGTQNGYGYHPNAGLQVPGIPSNDCK